ISNTPDPMPRMGFATSALPPSAAIVRAARQIDLAPSGNVSNSCSAALIQEMGRVFRVIGVRYCIPLMLSYLTTLVKKARRPSLGAPRSERSRSQEQRLFFWGNSQGVAGTKDCVR